MADVKLLPCRCGGKPTLHENAEHWFRVACPECASSTIWRSRKKAIAEWNAANAPAPVEPALASPGVTAGASVAANAPEPVDVASSFRGFAYFARPYKEAPDALFEGDVEMIATKFTEAADLIASLSAQVKSLAWEIDNPETGWRVRVERAEDDAWRKNEAVFSFYMREIDAESDLAAEREAHQATKRERDEAINNSAAAQIDADTNGTFRKIAEPNARKMREALSDLVEAATAEFNEKGAGGYALARLTDARTALQENNNG